jgi:hypothetical protein
LPLEGVAESKPAAVEGTSQFICDDARTIFIGGKRLDVLLDEKGFGWVLKMRAEMERLDYRLLTARYSGLGRRPYHPRTVLSLILFGALMRQFTLRELEDLSGAHLAAWWLCGGNAIDHSTIGKFIVHHDEALSESFFVAMTAHLLKELKIKPGVAGVDGTVMEAAGSRFATLRKDAAAVVAAEAKQRAEAEPENRAAQQEAEQAAAVVTAIEERTATRRAQRKDESTVAVVATEPEAVLQPRKDGAMRPAYQFSTMVHEEGFVVGQHVNPSSETAAVQPMLEQHRGIFGGENPATMLGDAGYFKPSVLREAVEQEIDFLCPPGQTFDPLGKWEKKSSHELYPKSAFVYDEAQDVYVCPAGEHLRPCTKGRDRTLRYQVYATRVCSTCALKTQCTSSRKGRRIKRYEGEEYKEAMREVLANPRARAMYRRRMSISEPVFAEFRERLGLRRFRRRGLRGVRAEAGLYSMALNLKRALNHPAWALVWQSLARRGSDGTWRAISAGRALLAAIRGVIGDRRPWRAHLMAAESRPATN